MFSSLALPALVLLLAFPGFGGLKSLRPKHDAAPLDSLPPPWKTASLLALEDEYVRAALPPLVDGPVSFRVLSDQRRLRVGFDPREGVLTSIPELGEVTIGEPTRVPLSDYSRQLTRRNFRQQWEERSRQSINVLGTHQGSAPRSGLSFQLPSPLPRRVQSLLGPGGPALNISGSENIRLSGVSNWTNQQAGRPLGQKQSLFPSLDMQQDLNIRLEGQLSDRVRVNLLQNSGVQIPLANRIAINYKGEEDDLIQSLDLGNTNLTLPGTQYVSYSGKNEGLFGVKLASRMGPLDFTMLASKQEGRSERASYAGGASRQTQTLRDHEYIRGVYFFLYDPNFGAYDIPDSSIRVYFDDGIGNNDVNTVNGLAMVDPGDTSSFTWRGTYAQLNPGPDQDYEILRDIYGPVYKVIRLRRPMSRQLEQSLAVTYVRRPVDANGNGVGAYAPVGGEDVPDPDDPGAGTARVMKLIWAPPNLMRTGDYFDPDLPLTAVRELELKNFYQLAGQRIDLTTLKIAIRKGVDQPPVTNLVTPDGTSVPYIEVLGLDNFDETTGTPFQGHDALVDGTFAAGDTRLFVDEANGTLFFYDPRPFAPRIGPDGKPFEIARSNELFRRATLAGPPDERNPDAYDKYNLQRDTDALYYIDVEFTASRASGEIALGRTNIVEGSETVTINGEALARDRDYTIDYDLGRVTLKRQLRASDNLNVDYSYAPLFQQAGRTLLGSAFRMEGRDRSFGGAFLYESKGAQDLRPRLGEEPSRSLIADLNTEWRFRPEWVTRMVDRLPGVRTTAPSDFHLQAEVGASFPNPNTRNEVYVDDMEGVRDAVSASMTPERWRRSSVPSRATQVTGGVASGSKTMIELQDDSTRIHNAELHWYSPYAVVKEEDLKPTLTRAQGGENNRQVLALSVPRRPRTARNTPGDLDTLWAGITYPLDVAGLDLSQAQFIEMWVNDFNDALRIRDPHVRLHIDLGEVSENQMRAPDQRPNSFLDSEDLEPRDNQLVVTSGKNEDTGLDGWETVTERDSVPQQPGYSPPLYLDLVTSSESDPSGDDFHAPSDQYKEIDPRRYISINGTEGNKTIYPVPDTEDLNLDNRLNVAENYYEYTIDLGDTGYVVTDVQRDFPGQVPADNGWRRYRIPIADTARVQFGLPDLTRIKHIRMWIEGFIEPDPPPDGNNVQRPLLMLGSLEIVGSRWRIVDLDTTEVDLGTTLTLNAVNTVDNADIYVAPFDPGETRSGSEGLTRREQSIAMEFTDLQPDSTLEAFRTFSLDEDYSRYGTLNWFVTGFETEDDLGALNADSLAYFVRFASDERGVNYYEYRSPVPQSTVRRGLAWREVKLALTELSNLKLNPDFSPDSAYLRPRVSDPRDTLIVKGRPSFTRIRRISFGLLNRATAHPYRSGQLWFNELRATDIAKDAGRAQRVQLDGRVSNLLSYNMSWDGRDEDFLTVGQSRGSGVSNSRFTFGTNVDVHRFFEGTGIVLPVAFNFSQNSSKPRFSAGDDVVRTDALASASETFSDSRNWSTGYSRTWSSTTHPLLLYTVGGISANISTTNNHSRNPNAIERARSTSAQVNYQISPRRLFSFGVPGLKTRIFPLPERFYWNYLVQQRQSQVYDRVLATGELVPRALVKGRAAEIRFGADTQPFELLRHHFEAVRNLTLGDNVRHLGFIHLGKVVNWSQTLSSRYTFRQGPWLSPSLNWSSRYQQDNLPQVSRELLFRRMSNAQALSMSWMLPFDGLTRVRKAALDSTQQGSGVAAWRQWLSRIGNITTEAAANWSSDYTRVQGTAPFLYLVGLTRDPGIGGRIRPALGNVFNLGFNWRASARTRIALLKGASLQTAGEYNSREGNANDVTSRQDSYRFPDLQMDYGQIANALKLDRILKNPRLRTSFNNSRTTEYSRGVPITGNTSSQWQPLLGLNGDLKNGTRVDLSIERRITKRESFLNARQSIATDRNTDVNLSLNRSYTQGQRVSILGRETTVRSSVNLGMSIAYSRQSGETVQTGDRRPRFPVKRDRLSVNGNGSYGFSNNVTGTLALGFSQDRDLQTEVVRRSVRVELRASFTF